VGLPARRSESLTSAGRVKDGVPLVSLCTTNYNSSPATRESLESVLSRVQGLDVEMVVVDNWSVDGSYEVLASFGDRVDLTLVRARSSRGVGRDLAFRRARGQYVVTFDCDTIYNDDWRRLLDWVLAERIPYRLSATFSQFYPRGVLESVGGWRDLQYWEDMDLWTRLSAKGLYRAYPLICGTNRKPVAGRDLVTRWLRVFARSRDQVALADWIPFRLYARGYRVLARNEGTLRASYRFISFLPAFAAGRRKRRQLWDQVGPSILADPSLFMDLGLVPREALGQTITVYDSRSGCESAVASGDIGFLPARYD